MAAGADQQDNARATTDVDHESEPASQSSCVNAMKRFRPREDERSQQGRCEQPSKLSYFVHDGGLRTTTHCRFTAHPQCPVRVGKEVRKRRRFSSTMRLHVTDEP
jgi:hypothetical protein